MLGDFSEEMRSLLERWLAEEGARGFSDLCRRDLFKLLGSREAVALIEAQCEICAYWDSAEYASRNRWTLAELRRRGLRLPRGKRPRPELTAFVEGVAPIIQAFGVSLRAGENARMVRILRRIAAELWPDHEHDPRDALRRVVRRERDSELRAQTVVYGAIAEALACPGANDCDDSGSVKQANIAPHG